METWATFSIIDHRAPIYRQALALFDRIVVPIPPKPIGDQTEEELEQLSADVSYLEENGAAIFYEWSSSDFQEWRQARMGAALAASVNRDAYRDTRDMLAHELTAKNVRAIPVFGEAQYDEFEKSSFHVEEALRVRIAQRIPLPEFDTPLESLVRLRDDPGFQVARESLLAWIHTKMPAIVLSANKAAAVESALTELDKHARKYTIEMENAGFHKAGTISSILWTAGSAPLAALWKGLTSWEELRQPCWRKLNEMQCAPGGVIYHAAMAAGAATGMFV